MAGNQRRVYQISERIREIVASELLLVADPRLQLITVTSVVTSSDLRHAKIYWVVSDKQKRQEVEHGFESAKGRFSRVVAKKLAIRYAPTIHFFYDDTLETSEQVHKLLNSLALERKQGEEDA